ncbi:MAG: CubicO group peptidase (beta-lactamase class C family) [Myxococcota bacterium]|jgi:CubicO group peptidase (beta-lactamase class C family)
MRWSLVLGLVALMGCGADSDDSAPASAPDAVEGTDTLDSADADQDAAPDQETEAGGPDGNVGPVPDPPPTKLEPPALDFGPVQAELEAFVADSGVDGIGLSVVHRDWGVVFTGAAGDYDVGRTYYVASSTKIVTAGMMMTLADDGLIDINGRLDAHVDWATTTGHIKPWQLVANSSGLPGLLTGPNNTVYADYVCQFLNLGTLTECAKTIAQADVGDDALPPGAEFRYGGGQWQLAGGLMEAVTGKTWAELYDQTYGEPCGLTGTGYTAPLGGELGYPSGLKGDLSNVPNTQNPSMEAGLYTNLADYARILSIHLNDGWCGWDDDAARVLSAEAVATMREDHIASYGGSTGQPGMQGYGLGWWINRDNPDLIQDPGAWGAVPWLNLAQGYGAFITLETNPGQGRQARIRLQPLIESALQGEQ